MSRTDLGQYIRKSPVSVTNSLKRLVKLRQVVKTGNGNYTLTPVGTKRIKDELAARLSLE
jgi:Mn-dependent DtxR family transcriptional regulator